MGFWELTSDGSEEEVMKGDAGSWESRIYMRNALVGLVVPYTVRDRYIYSDGGLRADWPETC